MTPDPTLTQPHLSVRAAGAETLIRRFEADWLEGKRPRLDDFLSRLEAGERPALLVELVHAELELRLKAGEPVRAEEYLGRYPELNDHAVRRELVAAEQRLRASPVPAEPSTPSVPGSRTVAQTSPSPAAGAPIAAAPRPPAVHIPGYEVLGKLGQGGMGVVYKARQVGLDRVVALKMVLDGRAAGPGGLERFRAEAQALARLQHPNIVQVFDVSAHDGKPYFSLEYVEGGSLDKKLTAAGVPPRQAAQLAATLARAVHAAHEAGVVHRDLKPANVLVTKQWELKITDFGLAKRLDQDSGRTRAGEIMGTPSYMAPEQAGGRVEAVGPPADVYALGAILYELLTGRPPFRGPNVMETLRQVLDREPAPPSQLQSGVPRDLETICLKCLEKAPARRYPSAAALADDLERFRKGEPISARPVGRLERVAKWARRNPAPTAAAVAVLLIAVVAFAVVLGYYFDAARARDDKATALTAQTKAAKDAESALGQAKEARGQAEQAAAAEKEARGKQEEEARRANTSNYVNLLGRAAQAIEAGDRGEARDLLLKCRPDLRHWEWGWLWQRCQDRGRLLDSGLSADPQTSRNVTAAAFAPDGRSLYLATNSNKHNSQGKPDVQDSASAVIVWDTVAGRPLRFLGTHPYYISDIALRPGGKWLAIAAYADPTHAEGEAFVQLWDIDADKEVRTLKSGPGGHVAFSRDGARLAGSAADGGVAIWDAESGQLMRRFEPSEEPEASVYVAFSPDGKQLAITQPRKVELWDTASGKHVREFLAFMGGSVALFPDGCRLVYESQSRILATGVLQGGATIWQTETGTVSQTFFGLAGPLAVSPSGRWLAGTRGKSVAIWDALTGRWRTFQPPGLGGIGCLAFSADSKKLAAGLNDTGGTAEVWDLSDEPDAPSGFVRDAPDVHQDAPGTWLETGAVSADGRRAADVMTNGILRVYDLEAGRISHSFRVALDKQGDPEVHPTIPLFSLAISPEGRFAAVGKEGSPDVTVWDLESGVVVGTVPQQGTHVSPLLLGPEGRLLVHGGGQAPVKIVEVQTGKVRCTWEGALGDQRLPLALSPDGRLLAIGGGSGCCFYDADSGREVWRCLPEDVRVHEGAFSADGTRFAAFCPVWKFGPLMGVRSPEIDVFDAVRHERQFSLPLHDAAHNLGKVAMDFSADGRRLAAIDSTQLTVWEMGTGQQVISLPCPPELGLARTVFGAGDRTVFLLPLGFRPGNRVRRLETDWESGPYSLSGLRPGTDSGVFSPDGARLLTLRQGTRLVNTPEDAGRLSFQAWDTITGQELYTLDLPSDYVWSRAFPPVAFSPDGSQFVIAAAIGGPASQPGPAKTPEEKLQQLRALQRRIIAQASGPPEGPMKTILHFRDAATGRELRTREFPGATVSLAWSPDGEALAGTDADGVWLLNARTGEERFRKALPPLAHPGKTMVYSLCFSPDGDRLLYARTPIAESGWSDGEWGVCSARDGQELLRAGAGLDPEPRLVPGRPIRRRVGVSRRLWKRGRLGRRDRRDPPHDPGRPAGGRFLPPRRQSAGPAESGAPLGGRHGHRSAHRGPCRGRKRLRQQLPPPGRRREGGRLAIRLSPPRLYGALLGPGQIAGQSGRLAVPCGFSRPGFGSPPAGAGRSVYRPQAKRLRFQCDRAPGAVRVQGRALRAASGGGSGLVLLDESAPGWRLRLPGDRAPGWGGGRQLGLELQQGRRPRTGLPGLSDRRWAGGGDSLSRRGA